MSRFFAKVLNDKGFAFGYLTDESGEIIFQEQGTGKVFRHVDVHSSTEAQIGECGMGFSLDENGNWTTDEVLEAAVELAKRGGFRPVRPDGSFA